MRLGIIGAGSIASVVVDALRAGHLDGVELVGVAGRDTSSARAVALAERAGTEALDVEGLLERDPDWVLEAAGVPAVRAYALRIVDRGVGLIVISSGGLLDSDLWSVVAERRLLHDRIVVPSGGIAGLDALAALRAAGGLASVALTTFKPPASLRKAPFVIDGGIVLSDVDAQVVFEGNVLDAIRGFPANINVGASVSIAGIGPERTRVRIVSDPGGSSFRQVLEATGEAGSLHLEVRSTPNPNNPASSYLSALSAVAAIQQVRGRGGGARR